MFESNSWEDTLFNDLKHYAYLASIRVRITNQSWHLYRLVGPNSIRFIAASRQERNLFIANFQFAAKNFSVIGKQRIAFSGSFTRYLE